MRIIDHFSNLLRNLYPGQEATVRTEHGTRDWFKTGKGVCQGCILSPCLFNLFAEYFMWNAGLDESQLESRLLGEGSTTSEMQMIPLVAESEEELNSFSMRVKEKSEQTGLKLNIQQTKTMTSGPITSWQIEVARWKQCQILFYWAPKSLQTVNVAMKLRCLLLGRKAVSNLDNILKSRDVTLPTKVQIIKVMVFPEVMYGCLTLDHKEV